MPVTMPPHAMIGNALRSRALMTNALCAVAEEEIYAGRLAGAEETVRSVRRLLADIDLLLSGDTPHLAPGTLSEVSDLLAGLNDRIGTLELRLAASRVN